MKNLKYLLIAGIIIFTACSPKAPIESAKFEKNDFLLEFTYGRPYTKGKVVFGNEAEGALVPYGKYWVMGAKKPTIFTTSKNINFAGNPLPAGTYSIHAVVQENHWLITLNKVIDGKASERPNKESDVFTAKVSSMSKLSESIEQFTIDFENDNTGLYIRFRWDTTVVYVLIT